MEGKGERKGDTWKCGPTFTIRDRRYSKHQEIWGKKRGKKNLSTGAELSEISNGHGNHALNAPQGRKKTDRFPKTETGKTCRIHEVLN